MSSLGLAPTVVDQMFALIRTIHGEASILLVEQNVVRALEIAADACIREPGCIVANDSPATLRRGSRIQAAYFGRITDIQSPL